MAARCGEDHRGLPADTAREGVVSRGVARMEGEHEVGVSVPVSEVDLGVTDGPLDEANPIRPAELASDGCVAFPRLRLDIHADQLDRQPASDQEAIRGEGEVGIATAEIHDT